MTTGFVGEPVLVRSHKAWLVPRPYSGDLLLMDQQSLQPAGRIDCGGKPYAAHLFDDGAMVILDHPWDRFHTSHLSALKTD